MTISTQPPAIDLCGPQPQNNLEASTAVRIIFRFEPEEDEQVPPRMVSSEIKLTAMTFFGMDTWHEFPDHSKPSVWGPRQTYRSKAVFLSAEKHFIDWKLRKKTDESGASSLFYTASIDTLASLPHDRVYTPILSTHV